MSKSIEIYFDLKLHQFENNEENVDFSKLIYLFRIGVFYLFFNNDAIKFSKLLNLQIVKYGNNAIDCGFPVSAIEKYSKLINNSGYNFRIVVLEDSKLTNNPYRVYKTNFLPIGNEEELLKNEIILDNGQIVPVSRNYRKSTQDAFALWAATQMR